MIRCLIETNPRDQLVIGDQQSNPDHGVVGQKRKSEENKRTGDSPEQKRNSSELQGVLEAEGLPSDLQRMKKEQLVNELVKRGQTEYSMKNLKSELIDALKTILLGEGDTNKEPAPHQDQLGVTEGVVESQDEEVLDSVKEITQEESSSSLEENQPPIVVSLGPTIGRGSMALSSIRSQVRESLAVENVGEKLQHPRASMEAELQARLLRHRDSQALKPVNTVSLSISLEEVQNKDYGRVSAIERGKVSEMVVPVVELLVGQDENEADDVISSDEIVTENTPEDIHTANASNQPIVTEKPSNLLSNQTSFLAVDKKPMVPALLKAERLKEQEELRQAERKKKEAERKVRYFTISIIAIMMMMTRRRRQ